MGGHTMCCIAIVPALFIKSKSTLDEDYEPFDSSNIGNSLVKFFKSFIEGLKVENKRIFFAV